MKEYVDAWLCSQTCDGRLEYIFVDFTHKMDLTEYYEPSRAEYSTQVEFCTEISQPIDNLTTESQTKRWKIYSHTLKTEIRTKRFIFKTLYVY